MYVPISYSANWVKNEKGNWISYCWSCSQLLKPLTLSIPRSLLKVGNFQLGRCCKCASQITPFDSIWCPGYVLHLLELSLELHRCSWDLIWCPYPWNSINNTCKQILIYFLEMKIICITITIYTFSLALYFTVSAPRRMLLTTNKRMTASSIRAAITTQSSVMVGLSMHGACTVSLLMTSTLRGWHILLFLAL